MSWISSSWVVDVAEEVAGLPRQAVHDARGEPLHALALAASSAQDLAHAAPQVEERGERVAAGRLEDLLLDLLDAVVESVEDREVRADPALHEVVVDRLRALAEPVVRVALDRLPQRVEGAGHGSVVHRDQRALRVEDLDLQEELHVLARVSRNRTKNRAAPPIADSGEDVELLEVEIFYTKGTLVTVHDRPWPALDALWEAIQRDPIHGLGKGAQTIYHDLVQRGVSAYFSVLDRFDERVEEIERKVFETAGGDTLPALFHLRRSVRQVLRAARSQRESVQRLAAGVVHSLTRETCYLFRDVHDQLLLIHDTLDDHRETLGSLRDTYLGVINNRMSEIMKTLTIFSAVLLPLAFLTGLYGMNFDVLPGKSSPRGLLDLRRRVRRPRRRHARLVREAAGG